MKKEKKDLFWSGIIFGAFPIFIACLYNWFYLFTFAFYLIGCKSDLVNLSVSSEKGREVALSEMNAAFVQFKSNVSQWISSHLIISPTDGTVQVTNKFLKSGQYVNKDEPLLIIIPPQSNMMKGIMNVPFNESGNIKRNQLVLVRLQSGGLKRQIIWGI